MKIIRDFNFKQKQTILATGQTIRLQELKIWFAPAPTLAPVVRNTQATSSNTT